MKYVVSIERSMEVVVTVEAADRYQAKAEALSLGSTIEVPPQKGRTRITAIEKPR